MGVLGSVWSTSNPLRIGVVLRQQFWLCLCRLGKLLFQRLRNALMILLARPLQQ
jgi:hypothetical protein